MDLYRLHAFAVRPSRTAESAAFIPEGGAIGITEQIATTLKQAIDTAKFDTRTSVDFCVDTSTRTCKMRDLVVSYAFCQPEELEQTAIDLAGNLSGAMDSRSNPCLLVMGVFIVDNEHLVTLWIFPRDNAFQFRHDSSGSAIELLTDIFSQGSKLRKAAHFKGRNLRSDFLSGRVLDFQSTHSSRGIADFWIHRFLDCRFSLRDEAGTRLLANALKKAYETCTSEDSREQLYSAMVGIRHTPQNRFSLNDFCERYLSGNARESFLGSLPDRDNLTLTFEFQRECFDATLKFRVFRLDTGVFVSSPFDEIGASVRISEDRTRRLVCQGTVVEDKLRKRHA